MMLFKLVDPASTKQSNYHILYADFLYMINLDLLIFFFFPLNQTHNIGH